MSPMSINAAIMSFAFSGMLGAHRQDYQAPREMSQDAHARLSSKRATLGRSAKGRASIGAE